MALDTYANLQLAVADWMHRNDLSGNIADFIRLTEVRTTRLLNSRIQQLASTITTQNGIQYADMPSDLLRVVSASIPQSSPNLEYVSMDQLNHDFSPDEVGVPRVYTTVGSLIYFGPTPDAAYSVTTTYQMQIPPLSDLAPLNSLLATWPDVYLWGAVHNAAKFSENPAKMQQFESDYLRAVDEVNIIDWHAGGPMRVRSDVRSV